MGTFPVEDSEVNRLLAGEVKNFMILEKQIPRILVMRTRHSLLELDG